MRRICWMSIATRIRGRSDQNHIPGTCVARIMSGGIPGTLLPSCLWTPGQGPDRAALDRMIRAFPKPATPMGEAWFMGDVRGMYPQLRGGLDALPDADIERALVEIATGSSNFGPKNGSNGFTICCRALSSESGSRPIINPPRC